MTTKTPLQQRFHQLIEQHKGILFKVAKTYCRDPEDRQDLLQEMMIQVWRSLHNYNDKFALTTWLYRVALNVAISFYRKNASRLKANKLFRHEHLPIEQELNHDQQNHLNLLEQFIAQLNHLDKALILLYLEDKSHAEISEITGLSVSNVGTRVGRIKEKLKKKFAQTNL